MNQFAGKSPLFDNVMGALPNNLLLNGGILTALFWAAWVRRTPEREKDRSFLTSGIILSVIALTISRVLALSLPFRERPRFASGLGFRMPLVQKDVTLIDWSSFPSDHAVLYFSLATILFFVSWKIGFFAYFHAAFVVCFPLLYLGIHYPTDVICGALIGVGIASLALVDRIREGIARPARLWRTNSAVTFYPILYLWTLLTATEFDSVRSVAAGFWTILKRTL